MYVGLLLVWEGSYSWCKALYWGRVDWLPLECKTWLKARIGHYFVKFPSQGQTRCQVASMHWEILCLPTLSTYMYVIHCPIHGRHKLKTSKLDILTICFANIVYRLLNMQEMKCILSCYMYIKIHFAKLKAKQLYQSTLVWKFSAVKKLS